MPFCDKNHQTNGFLPLDGPKTLRVSHRSPNRCTNASAALCPGSLEKNNKGKHGQQRKTIIEVEIAWKGLTVGKKAERPHTDMFRTIMNNMALSMGSICNILEQRPKKSFCILPSVFCHHVLASWPGFLNCVQSAISATHVHSPGNDVQCLRFPDNPESRSTFSGSQVVKPTAKDS